MSEITRTQATEAEGEALLALAAACGGTAHVELIREAEDGITVLAGYALLHIDSEGRVRRQNAC